MEKLNIYQKLQTSRVQLQEKGLSKSGNNKFAGFKYFELADFLPSVNEIFNQNGLFSIFNIKRFYTENGEVREIATLTITDGEKEIVFETPTAEPRPDKTPNPIQELGSKHTYTKRYLYLNALEIAENDAVDATIGKDKETKTETPIAKNKATDKQIEMIKNLYSDEEITKMLSNLKVKDLTEINIEQASKMIAARKENNGTSTSTR